MKGRKGSPILIAMFIWISFLGFFIFWLKTDARREDKLLALATAKAFFQQVLVSRSWNASHGGVYVPITATTQPNKYLPPLNRDLTTDNGVKLTLVNPAYMTRQIAELAEKSKSEVRFHITSLKPIRPANKAAKWEERWLKSFEHGVKEQGEFFDDGKITWFRYMAPLITGPNCLKCHARQGYKVGDIRGGLSVSLPYPGHSHASFFISLGFVAAIGLLFIFVGGTLYERKRLLFDAIFDNSIPTCVTNKNYTIMMANNSYWHEFGPITDHQKTIKCYEHRPGESCHTDDCMLTEIMSGESKCVRETSMVHNGQSRNFIVTAKPLLDSRGKMIGIVESFQEITERKRAEKALEESRREFEALSLTDGLTGIANRRSFDEVLAREYARHSRSGAELSLILLDIDHFKSFNDCYGHVSGDECLRQIAQVIADCAGRPADLAARYGGEEFACILPETDSSGALAIARKIHRDIIALAVPHKESNVADYVTASLGVVTVRCTAEGSVTDVIAQVDELLYLAKASGRNRVEFAASGTVGQYTKDHFVQLAWKDSFCCGNQLIDSQHKTLFNIANELLDAVISTHPVTEISAIITKLLDEVSQHFHDEEVILKEVGFPGISQHAEEHAKLLEKGLELSREFKASTLTVGDVFQFLANEVVMVHMLGSDREFFPFIKEAGAAATKAVKSA